mmetsp:Transcript_21268/g.51963  ORF Transcript_21268/g.51963 Transcript_21268/m.51963 type:complete len:126 (+) Transcript_21268:1457-1834(+)
MMANLRELASKIQAGGIDQSSISPELATYPIVRADDFEYKDPVDGSVSSKQGIRYIFSDGSRIVWRLSGTGSVGATIRVYLEKYESDKEKMDQRTEDALQLLSLLAAKISNLEALTGRTKPDVIT